ncbi:hypothetical protein QFZ27_004829 [Inquilinus ginsengisoli]|uniref:hypothetical protein n=1 Tax=Inquilinus ginsengisoli TaxID=363840 RepID=UPI003D1AE500
MLRILSFLALAWIVLPPGLAAAEWTIDREFRDPVTSELVRAATATNADGISIRIYRAKDQRVVGFYSLPDSSLDRLPGSGRILVMRPGDKDSAEISIDPKRPDPVDTAWASGLWVREVLWHGEGRSPTTGTLRDILDSDRLTLQFYTDTGSKIDSVIDLKGARAAISGALGIDAVADPKAIAEDRLRTQLALAAGRRCPAQANMDACVAAFTACADYIVNMVDESGFRACLRAKGYPLP